MMNGKKKEIKTYITVFSLNLLVALLVFGAFMIKDRGLFSLSNDFNAQELPFNIFANQAIKDGQVFFNWSIDIGSDFVSSLSFYNLGSPFFWITLLFPATAFPYLVGWIFILKYAVAGLTSFAYFKSYIKNVQISFLGSLLYAFSGFQASNIVFYHFHDIVAFFPLMLLSLDCLIMKQRKGCFALAVGLNALVNWNFFVGEVLFVLLYYFIRFSPWKNLKENIKKVFFQIFSCLFEGILGVGIAGVLFIPSVYTMLSNTRVENHILGINGLSFSTNDYLQFIKALLLPNETLTGQSVLENSNWYSIAGYLPMVGLTFVITHFWGYQKRWINRLICISLIIAIVPVLNNSFTLFNTEAYRRWYYMPILIMALATCYVLNDIYINGNIELKKMAYKSIGILMVLIVLLTVYLTCFKWSNDRVNAVNNLLIYFIYLLIGFLGLLISWIILKSCKKKAILILNVMVALFGGGTTAMNILHYQSMSEAGDPKSVYNEILKTTDKLQSDVIPYRYSVLYDSYYNRNMSNSLTSRNSFISTVDNGIFEFYDAIGYHRHTSTPEGPEGTNELLSVKYYISERSDMGEPVDIINNGNKDIYVYMAKNSLPIGFTYDTYVKKSEFETLEKEKRSLVMLRTLVIPDETEAEIQEYLSHYNLEGAPAFDQENLSKDIYNRQKESSEYFTHSTDGFISKITVEGNKYAFFSVPYETRWNATVNGKNVNIIDINGLMAVPVTEGENEIIFSYSKRVHLFGAVVSLSALLIWIIYSVPSLRKNRG